LRLSLSLPIFEGLQRVQQVTQAQVAVENAQAALRDARLAALQGLTQSLGSFHAAEERVATQLATVGAAEEDLREQQEKYQIGAATLLDVLTSQTTLDQARHDLIQARYDQRVAKAQLEALTARSL
jgi:outer membrane protein